MLEANLGVLQVVLMVLLVLAGGCFTCGDISINIPLLARLQNRRIIRLCQLTVPDLIVVIIYHLRSSDGVIFKVTKAFAASYRSACGLI